jgi:hypothetical protein
MSPAPTTLPAGLTRATFRWDGRSWEGPSDTGNPEGPAFPAGSYNLRISAVGTVNGTGFTVAATSTIFLAP